MQQVKIGGRDIPLIYNLRAMAEMERVMGRSENVIKELKGENRVGTLIKLIRVMAHGAKEQVDEEWLWEAVKPADFYSVYIQVMNAYSEGMRVETSITDDKTVDVGLLEIKKKKAKG